MLFTIIFLLIYVFISMVIYKLCFVINTRYNNCLGNDLEDVETSAFFIGAMWPIAILGCVLFYGITTSYTYISKYIDKLVQEYDEKHPKKTPKRKKDIFNTDFFD